jgi:hypothetical protein
MSTTFATEVKDKYNIFFPPCQNAYHANMNYKAVLHSQGRVSPRIGWYFKQVVALLHTEEKEESGRMIDKEIKIVKIIGPLEREKRENNRKIKIY